jgi:hypothetical protein
MIFLQLLVKVSKNVFLLKTLIFSILEIRRILESSIGFVTDKDPNFRDRDFSNRRIRKPIRFSKTTMANRLFPVSLTNDRFYNEIHRR